MAKGRILVVDDLPDWRNTLVGLLSDEGYEVRPASSSAEALQALEAGRFHLALLDVRLDETDEDNREGLQLMRQLKTLDPTIAIIILTAYTDVKILEEALRPDPRTGHSPAVDSLQKSNINQQLIDSVQRVFRDEVKIDYHLTIDQAGTSLPQLAGQLYRYLEPKRQPHEWIDEIDELLRRLFFGLEQIHIRTIRTGYSKTVVFEVVPWFQPQERGESRIVKIGGHRLVEAEIQQHNRIKGRIGGNRLPETLTTARTRSLSGIVYTFVGLGSAEDFAAFFQHSDSVAIEAVIQNLFQETCFPWQRHTQTTVPDIDLSNLYMRHLGLNVDHLSACLVKTMGGRHPFCSDEHDGNYFWLGDNTRLINPVAWLQNYQLTASSQIGLIHGDLHGYNVLVDRHLQTWLIDFADTGEGPALLDYAKFETFIRVSLVQSNDWLLLYTWEHALFSTDFLTPTLPLLLQNDETIVKAHHAVAIVRRLALQNRLADMQREYLVGLMLNALKLITILGLPPAQRDHALITAAVIAEQLQQNL
ncbi:MAG: response regulator [Anaerolineales bacterium]|nr:response regulator [Anaerolineales bacterium]